MAPPTPAQEGVAAPLTPEQQQWAAYQQQQWGAYNYAQQQQVSCVLVWVQVYGVCLYCSSVSVQACVSVEGMYYIM